MKFSEFAEKKYNPKEWGFFKSGANNQVYAHKAYQLAYKVRIAQDDETDAALDAPERTQRLLTILNPKFPAILYHEGVLMKFVQGSNPTTTAMIKKIINVYYRHRKILCDAAVSGNVVVTNKKNKREKRKNMVVLDPGMALTLTRGRNVSQASLDYWDSNGKDVTDQYLEGKEMFYSANIIATNKTVKALLYLQLVYPEVKKVWRLKTYSSHINLLADAYTHNTFIDIEMYGFTANRKKFIEKYYPILKALHKLNEIYDENLRLFFLNADFSPNHIDAINFLTNNLHFEINDIAKLIAWLTPTNLTIFRFFLDSARITNAIVKRVLHTLTITHMSSNDFETLSYVKKEFLCCLIGLYGFNDGDIKTISSSIFAKPDCFPERGMLPIAFKAYFLGVIAKSMKTGDKNDMLLTIVKNKNMTFEELKGIAEKTKNRDFLDHIKQTVEYKNSDTLKKIVAEQEEFISIRFKIYWDLEIYINKESSTRTWAGFFVNKLWLNADKINQAKDIQKRVDDAETLHEVKSLQFAERCISTIPQPVLAGLPDHYHF